MQEDDDFDFGFTIDDSPEDTGPSKAERIFDAIMPLLNNLKKNPEIDVIKWPNREQKIDEFIEKLEGILDENE